MNKNLYSDCAPSTSCLDLDGNGPRCLDGARLGARCGSESGAYPGWIFCIEGYCASDPGTSPAVSTCQPLKPAGSACRSDAECGRPNRCVTAAGGSVCAVPNTPAPLGSRCTIGDSCGAGEYCALPAIDDPLAIVSASEGTCALPIPAGQPCRANYDLCEGLAECVQGVCTPCE